MSLGDALGLEHRPGQARPAVDGHRMVGLLVGGVDVQGHEAETRLTTRGRAAPLLGGSPLVGGHDVRHDPVADHVALAEVHEGEVGHPAQHRLEADQAGAAAGHVDLGDVAGDHRLGAEPDAGEEHLHLLGGGVLGLVQDDEAVVEGASPHEGERRHLDRAPVEEPLGALAAPAGRGGRRRGDAGRGRPWP